MSKKRFSIIVGILLIILLSGCNANDVKDEDKETNLSVIDNKEKNEELDVEKVNTLSKIILYRGYEINPNIGFQVVRDMKISDEASEKYNITYYNYEKGKYFGESEGDFGEETYQGVSFVQNVKKVAISKKYDAIPRTYTVINELPKELSDMADYTKVDIHAIDLDNDGKNEYLVCATLDYPQGVSEDGDPVASSKIMLLDSNYSKVADLVKLKNGFWANVKSEENKNFLSLDDIEYIDIDEDGILEIIVEVPWYDGFDISVLKYSNGKIEGETNIEASLMP